MVPTLDDPADHFRQSPGTHAAIAEVQSVQFLPQNIHPIKRTVAR
jgi:hypothetical protein